MNRSALIILADGFEEIEAVTVMDILRRAKIHTQTAGLNPESQFVTGAHGISIATDCSLDQLQSDFDACILPGGMPGSRNLADSDRVLSLISVMHQEQKLIAAICAAPALVLSRAGILNHRRATCYPGMDNHFPETTISCDDAVVIDDNIITSRGVGTALAFALAIVDSLAGKDTADLLRQKTLARLS